MENMLIFTGWVIIIFGILQIILFFKLWGMTNDVRNLKSSILRFKEDEKNIIEAQLKALNGNKKEALELYKRAFHLNVIDLYNKTIDLFGSEDATSYENRRTYWQNKYETIAQYYAKSTAKLGECDFDIEKYDTYEKVHAIICSFQLYGINVIKQ